MTNNELFNSKEFEEKYHYDGALGSFCGQDGTSFYLWAPTAECVNLMLYQNGDGEEAPRIEELTAREKGVWSFQTEENLDGLYYRYEVTVDGVTRQTADPYAKACGINGHRSMVIDLARTNPEGWEEDHAPEKQSENIIYELHVKDYTWDKTSGVSDGKRGKYLGLVEAGTTLNGQGVHPTGLDYMKELGITHVQLLPIYDYGSVNEDGADEEFNWGYDPVNYNVPEGSYSSDPYHGEIRIKELKQVIQTLHANGLRVIMDVVYNHTYQLDSYLNRTVPGYYYRFKENGEPANGSGCGNDTASERSMCAKYILDSILYWAREYHFDGFRFDLMGLIPVDLMNEIRAAVDEEFGVGTVMLYGEPWRAQDTAARPGTILADKENLKRLHPQVGAFCDSTRDAIKGSLMQEDGRGFVNGGEYDPELHQGCLMGWSGMEGEYAVNVPSQTMEYMSCHDDWTLWDRLVKTMDEKLDYTGFDETIIRANKLAIALMVTCQGNLFLLSGEEAGRTKNGVKNSYNSPVTINRIDWERVWKMESLKDYYRGLLILRKQLPCLCDKSEHAAQWLTKFSAEYDACAMIQMGNPQEARWKKLIIIYNMENIERSFELPEGSWQLLCDGADSFLWEKESVVTEKVKLSPMTAMILGR